MLKFLRFSASGSLGPVLSEVFQDLIMELNLSGCLRFELS